MRNLKIVVIAALVAVLSIIASAALAAKPADTVALNGKTYTMNPKQSWAQAVVVKGDTIVYVGGDKGASAFIGKFTTVGDLKGRMMLPGFIDTHMHMLPMCVFSSGKVITFTTDKQKMLAELKAYVNANPDGRGGAISSGGCGTLLTSRLK